MRSTAGPGLIDISGALVCHRKVVVHLFLRLPLLPPPLRPVFFPVPATLARGSPVDSPSFAGLVPPVFLIIPRRSLAAPFCLSPRDACVEITGAQHRAIGQSQPKFCARHAWNGSFLFPPPATLPFLFQSRLDASYAPPRRCFDSSSFEEASCASEKLSKLI